MIASEDTSDMCRLLRHLASNLKSGEVAEYEFKDLVDASRQCGAFKFHMLGGKDPGDGSFMLTPANRSSLGQCFAACADQEFSVKGGGRIVFHVFKKKKSRSFGLSVIQEITEPQ